MPTDSERQDYSDLENRFRTGVPAEQDAEAIARVRGSVRRKGRRVTVLGVTATAAVIVAFAAAAILWPGASRPESSSAFAYDRVAEMIEPVDGVVHFVVASKVVQAESTATPEPASGSDPGEDSDAGESWRRETWIDSTRAVIRREVDFGDGSYIVRVESPDTWLSEEMNPYDPPARVTEQPVTDGDDMWANDPDAWLESGWTRSFSAAIEQRSCEVTEGVDPDGVSVWHVTWTESNEMATTHYEAVFRRADYVPLSVVADVQYTESFMPPGESHTTISTQIEVWEVVADDDIPEGFFDARADITDPDKAFDVYMLPDDPRTEDVDFKAYTVAEEAGLAPASSMVYRRGRAYSMLELEWSGMFAVQFGDSPQWRVEPATPTVTTFATNDRQDVDQYWGSHVNGPDETSGELDGHQYRLRTGPQDALLLTSIEDQAIVITGPDADTVLRMLGALVPLE